MALTGRVNTHIYQISQGLRASGEPPVQVPAAPTGGSITPLANLYSLIVPFLLPLAMAIYIFAPRPTPSMPTMGRITTVSVATPSIAFPEAVGGGAAALSTKRDSVRVVFVTNTNDSGSGSLRAAMDSAGVGDAMVFILFQTCGTITLTSDIDPANNLTDVYFAGQTACGTGIEVKTWRLQLEDGDSNVVVRYMRFHGSENNFTWQVNGGYNIIFDRNEFYWADYRLMEITGDSTGGGPPTVNITESYNLYTEGLSAFPWQHGGAPDSNPGPAIDSLTIWRNLAAHFNHRAPMCAVPGCEIVNNLFFNLENRGPIEYNNVAYVDIIGNYFKPGPATPSWMDYIATTLGECEDTSAPYNCTQQIYLYGNIYPNNLADTTLSVDSTFRGSKRGIACYSTENEYCTGILGDTVPSDQKSSTRVAETTNSPVARSIFAIEQAILDTVGVQRLINSIGAWRDTTGAGVPVADSLLTRVLEEWTDSSTTRVADSIPVPGGRPTSVGITMGTPYTDTDNGGLPDAFEVQCGLDIDDADDDISNVSTGYTWLERWFNGDLEKGQQPSWTDQSDNEDRFVILRNGVAIDSVAANITSYDDSDGWPGDIYKVVAKNVNGPSDTLTVGTAGCN